jgi:cytochrome c553
MKTATTLIVALGAALALSACSRSNDTPKPAATAAPPAAEPAAAATAAATPAAPPAPAAATQTTAASLVPPAPAEPKGSAEAGQQIAANGGANGVTACVSCHGAQGEGNPAGGFPRIAGQSQYYLAKQLTAFAKESRNNPIMTPIAKAMSEQQMRDVSAYYASAEAPATSPAQGANSKPAAAALERGRLLAGVGDESVRVQACANCHGPAGAGEAPSYPYLAGQHAAYLSTALTEWKGGARNTDASGQMPAIAKLLSDQDIAALAAFYSAQQPPAPAGRNINVASGSAEKPAVEAAANAAGPKPGESTPMQGTGSEQGSPVTGGSQGIGGGGSASGAGPSGSK